MTGQGAGGPGNASGGRARRRGGRRNDVAAAVPPQATEDVVHHHPPKDMAADVGFPIRGGQTLLIAYFPWEASEADIEREFSKFCRVKRVHLVVDKSSRKPRCFGFVKFMSKADAEDALRATTQGLVQLPDSRGHAWHLKAEWTKSGDMVVDDSETEQEVAKRKEERRDRVEARGGPGDATAGGFAPNPSAFAPSRNSQATKGGNAGGRGVWPQGSVAPKGALHPGVPPPLPPLQPRGYPGVQGPPLGLQSQQMPMMQHGQMPLNGLGLAQHPPPVTHQAHLQAHQSLQQSQAVGQQALYGGVSQQTLPMYSGQQIPPPYGGPSAGPPLYNSLGAAGVPSLPRDPTGAVIPQSSLAQDAPGLGGQSYSAPPQGYPPSQGYATAGQQAYAQQPQGYPPAQVPGHQSYAASQQAYAAASQQSYSASPQAYAASQQAYAAGQPGYAGHQQQPYAPQAQGYPPLPQASYASQPFQTHQPPPPQQQPPQQSQAAAAAQSYGAAGYAQHPGYAHSYGLSTQQSLLQQQGAYGYHPQPSAAPPPPGVMAYGSYTGTSTATSATASLQPHALMHMDDASQDTAAAMAVAAASVAPATMPPPAQQPAAQQATGHVSAPPTTVSASLNPPPGTSDTSASHEQATTVDARLLSSTASAQAPAASGDTQYLDMGWHLADMSLRDKSLPAPPMQQPPAPPASHTSATQWQQAEAFREAAAAAVTASVAAAAPTTTATGHVGHGVAHGHGAAGSHPSAVWNSFDDAAAKGMVDGLVGGEDVGTGWSTTHTS